MSLVKICCAALVASWGASLARASLIAYEPFDYPVGSGPGAGGIGFLPGGWTSAPGIMTVSPGPNPPGSLSVSGNALRVAPTGALTISRGMSTFLSTVGDTWVSVVHQRTELSPLPEWVFVGNIGIGSGLNGFYGLGGTTPASSFDSSVSYVGRGPDLLVAHFHFVGVNPHGELYLNPVNGPVNPIVSADLFEIWAGSQIRVGSQYFGGATGTFDEIRIGTSFQDVAVPAAPAGAMLAIAGCVIGGRRRRER